MEHWTYGDPAQSRSVAIAAAVDYWRAKAGPDAMPSRARIDPPEMRRFLSKLLLIDVDADGGFTYRLCGTEVAALNQRELTGRRADAESLGAAAPQFLHSYRRTVEEKRPILFTARMWWQGRDYAGFEQVNLPLSADGLTVNKLMCVIDVGTPGPG